MVLKEYLKIGSLIWKGLDTATGLVSSLPRGNMVKFQQPVEGRVYALAQSARRVTTRAPNPSCTEIEISSDEAWVVPNSYRQALKSIWAAGTTFTVLETYSNPEIETEWLGCYFESPPEFLERMSFGRLYATFSFKIIAGI